MDDIMTLSDAKSWALCALYYDLLVVGTEESSVDRVHLYAPQNLPRPLFIRATKDLWEKKLVSSETVTRQFQEYPDNSAFGIPRTVSRPVRNFNPENVTLSNEGIEAAEKIRADNPKLRRPFFERMDKDVPPPAPGIGHNSNEVIEFDDQDELNEIVNDIENIETAISNDNTLDEKTKYAVLPAIQRGRELISNNKITFAAMMAFLISPLHTVWNEIGSDFLKQEIAHLIDRLQSILGF
jgi:hypothetical protein